MILIDSVFINDGGGKILLDYLVTQLDFTTQKFVFLLDARIAPYNELAKRNVPIHYARSLSERNKFYFKNHMQFKKVFCLGNIPPPLTVEGIFINYLHSSYYVSQVERINLKHFILTHLKKIYFNFKVKNVDLWIVQTPSMQKNLNHNRNVPLDKIRILPFFKSLNPAKKKCTSDNHIFLYVSDGGPRKNHTKLFQAFTKFYDKCQTGELWVTISDSYPEVIKAVEGLRIKGYPIINKGFVGREQLADIYNSASFVIYPSLTESFGLGLVEACEFGCKILAADLEYVFDVCKPSYVFNPLKVNEIAAAFHSAISTSLPESQMVIKNEVEKLVELIESTY